jgi:tetratricopeptide (TPR) repeat protein
MSMSSRRRFGVTGLVFAFAATASVTAGAEIRPPMQTTAPGPAAHLTTRSVEAQLSGDSAKALTLAEKAIANDPNDPWGYYNRGDALRGLRRTDEAVAAFRDAEQRFTADAWGKSVAIWGQANALAEEGRCDEAAPIYERYARFVERLDASAAALARQYAKSCVAAPAK